MEYRTNHPAVFNMPVPIQHTVCWIMGKIFLILQFIGNNKHGKGDKPVTDLCLNLNHWACWHEPTR
jgi:hypothetical protein